MSGILQPGHENVMSAARHRLQKVQRLDGGASSFRCAIADRHLRRVVLPNTCFAQKRN